MLYPPKKLDQLRTSLAGVNSAHVRVIDGTTQAVAGEMARMGPVMLLNFASARNTGGGFLNGAKAQEEDLCRCSGLYACLLKCSEYYAANRQQQSLLYTDHSIFSPSVPFFKTSGTGDYLHQPFVASVLTAPAPNSRPFLQQAPNQTALLEATFERRWQNVLCIARDMGQRRVVLGAWGCGAFGGDPKMAAHTAARAIASHGAEIDEIVFAIPDKGVQSSANLRAFREVMLQEP